MTALENPRVTSIYGRRTHPITGKAGTMHHGLDEVDTKGNRNVRAIWATVKTGFVQGYNGGRGNTAYLYYSATLRVLNQHLASFSPAVLARRPLKQGDWVGVYGATGDSTGAHLHEEVQVLRGGRWVPVEPSRYVEVPNKLGVHPGNNRLDAAGETGAGGTEGGVGAAGGGPGGSAGTASEVSGAGAGAEWRLLQSFGGKNMQGFSRPDSAGAWLVYNKMPAGYRLVTNPNVAGMGGDSWQWVELLDERTGAKIYTPLLDDRNKLLDGPAWVPSGGAVAK